MAEVITFGHNASCDFVEKPCIVDNAIPEYSKGYFCNSTDKINDNACDPSRTTVAFCDLYDLSQGSQSKTSPIPDVYQYFDNPVSYMYYDHYTRLYIYDCIHACN